MCEDELVREIANRTDVSVAKTREVIRNFREVVMDTVATGEDVQLKGFGTFTRVTRGGNPAYNFQTRNVTDTVPVHNVPKFKAGMLFKRAVDSFYEK